MPKAGNNRQSDTLSSCGIEHHQSSRWQRLASIPEETFDRHIQEIVSEGKELTQAGLLKVAREVAQETGVNQATIRRDAAFVEALDAIGKVNAKAKADIQSGDDAQPGLTSSSASPRGSTPAPLLHQQ